MAPHNLPLRQALVQSVAAECGPVRAVRCDKTFTAWWLGEGREKPAQPIEGETLAQAVEAATPPIMALDLVPRGGLPAFVILETDERADAGKARHTLHFYTVKVSRCWRAVGVPSVTRKVAVPYAVHQGSLPMNAFEPRRPFSALTDCPLTGRQPGEDSLVELRPL